MKPTCMIKSHPKGISLIMDEQCEFETLVMDICKLFAESKDFFGMGDLILSLEGRTLSPEETLTIIEAIEINSEVKIPLILDESELRDVRTVGALDRFYFDRVDTNAKIFKGNVDPGETVSSDTGLLIIGDVKKNAKVVAKGNVVIVGKLEGEAFAGEPDDTGAAIVAGKFLSKTATIGGVSGEVNVKYRKILGMRNQADPIVVRLLHGYFHAEPLSGGLITQD